MGEPAAHERAAVYLDAGHPAEAVALLAAHLASAPDDVPALCVQGRALCLAGDPAAGAASARRAVALAPQNEWAWRVLSLALSASGEHHAARAAGRRAVELAPDNWRAHVQRVAVDVAAARVDAETQASASRAVELAPGEALTHFAAGNVALAKKRWKAAEVAYRRALAISPLLVAARNNLAVTMMRRGAAGVAAAGLVDILAEDPSSVRARRNLLAAIGVMLLQVRVVLGIVLVGAGAYTFGGSLVASSPDRTMMAVARLVMVAIGGVGFAILIWRFAHGAGMRLAQALRAVRVFDPLQFVVVAGLTVVYATAVVSVAVPRGQNLWMVIALVLYVGVLLVGVVRRRRQRS